MLRDQDQGSAGLGRSERGDAGRGGRGSRKRAVAHPVVDDVDGVPHYVTGHRPTAFGFDVLIGRRTDASEPRTKTVILTQALADRIRAWSAAGGTRRAGLLGLPLSSDRLYAFRERLGLAYNADQAAWWAERREELRTSSTAEFAMRHGLAYGTVREARGKLEVAKRRMPKDWWKKPAVMKLLLSDCPTAYLASRLGLSESYAFKLRQKAEAATRPV